MIGLANYLAYNNKNFEDANMTERINSLCKKHLDNIEHNEVDSRGVVNMINAVVYANIDYVDFL